MFNFVVVYNGSKVRTVGVIDDDMRGAAIKEPGAKFAVYDCLV